MTRILLVDDEAPARARLKRLLEAHSDFTVVGEAAHGLECLEKNDELKPDLLFLDIQMPELDGLDVARALMDSGSHQPLIVFATAYQEHALKAFELNALDYLLKPVSEERLAQTLSRVQKSKNHSEQTAKFLAALSQEQVPSRLALRCGAKFVVLELARISAVLSQDHYSAIRIGGRELLADDGLDKVCARLGGDFVRVHRSAVINLNFLKELEHLGDRKYVAALSDELKSRIPISRDRLPELKKRLGISD